MRWELTARLKQKFLFSLLAPTSWQQYWIGFYLEMEWVPCFMFVLGGRTISSSYVQWTMPCIHNWVVTVWWRPKYGTLLKVLSGGVPIKQSYDKLPYRSCMFCRNICLVKLTMMEEVYCTTLNMLNIRICTAVFLRGVAGKPQAAEHCPNLKFTSVLKFSDFTKIIIFSYSGLLIIILVFLFILYGWLLRDCYAIHVYVHKSWGLTFLWTNLS